MPKEFKFSYKIPVILEKKLIEKYGWHVIRRVWQESIIFEKIAKSEIKDFPDVSPQEAHAIDARCDTVVSFFPDPYNQVLAVRERLFTMSRQLPMKEKMYVHRYINENFPLDFQQKST